MIASHKIPLDGAQIGAITRMFSSSVVRELARKGRSPLFARLARQSGLTEAARAATPLAGFFDLAFQVLRQKPHRDEYIYKTALTQKILLGIHSLSTATMLTEFRVGKRKADVVILNGTSSVYEIKSERDNLDRLREQVSAYLHVFDHVNVITGENHLKAVEEAVPAEVGIQVLSDRFRISTLRPSCSNMRRITPSVVYESLQHREARQILERCGRRAPDVPNTQIHEAMKREFAQLGPEELHYSLVAVLKMSRSSLRLRDVVESMPKSLQAAALSVPMTARDRARLVQAMSVQLDQALDWA